MALDYEAIVKDFDEFLDTLNGIVYRRRDSNVMDAVVLVPGGKVAKVVLDHKELILLRDGKIDKVRYSVDYLTPVVEEK